MKKWSTADKNHVFFFTHFRFVLVLTVTDEIFLSYGMGGNIANFSWSKQTFFPMINISLKLGIDNYTK